MLRACLVMASKLVRFQPRYPTDNLNTTMVKRFTMCGSARA